MTATDELRRMLDERGIEYLDSEDDTTIYYAETGYRYIYSENPKSGWAQLFGYHLTPSQAIAATLGNGECERVKHGTKLDGTPRYRCSVCGYGLGDYRWAYCPKCGCRIKDGA